MNRDRHSKRRTESSWKNSGSNSGNSQGSRQNNNKNASSRKISNQNKMQMAEQIAINDAKIKEFKARNQVECAHCHQPINDMSTALTDRNSGLPIHFDCALEQLGESEKLESGDKITYIGQGRFGIVNFANPHDMKHFTIKKIIDWEDKEKKASWRDEMADLYSQVK